MRSVKTGKASDVHPAAVCCMVKIVSEAMSATDPRYLLDRRISRDPELLAEALKNREEPAGPGESKVGLTELQPGMRLTQPLKAFDGREVLGEDIPLDSDLIWRIWQLSALRPLHDKVVVADKTKKS